MLSIRCATELPHLRAFMRLGPEPRYHQHDCEHAEERLQVASTSLCYEHNKFKCLYLSQSLMSSQHCDWLGVLRSVCSHNLVKAMPTMAV